MAHLLFDASHGFGLALSLLVVGGRAAMSLFLGWVSLGVQEAYMRIQFPRRVIRGPTPAMPGVIT